VGKTTEMTPQADDAEARTAKKAAKKTTPKKRVAKKAAKKPTAKKRAAKKSTAKKRVTKKAAEKPATKKRPAKNKTAKKRASPKTSTAKASAPATAEPPPAEPLNTTAAAAEPTQPNRSEHRLTAQGDDRRTDERLDVPGLIEVDVEMFGYQREAREFGIGPVTDTALKIQTFGATVNLSLGGLCALIADPITEGSHCLVRFVNAGGGVRPELRWGLVMRCEEQDTGKFEVGVKFDSPLEHLDPDALVAA